MDNASIEASFMQAHPSAIVYGMIAVLELLLIAS